VEVQNGSVDLKIDMLLMALLSRARQKNSNSSEVLIFIVVQAANGHEDSTYVQENK
jgi:hypothetical protein